MMNPPADPSDTTSTLLEEISDSDFIKTELVLNIKSEPSDDINQPHLDNVSISSDRKLEYEDNFISPLKRKSSFTEFVIVKKKEKLELVQVDKDQSSLSKDKIKKVKKVRVIKVNNDHKNTSKNSPLSKDTSRISKSVNNDCDSSQDQGNIVVFHASSLVNDTNHFDSQLNSDSDPKCRGDDSHSGNLQQNYSVDSNSESITSHEETKQLDTISLQEIPTTPGKIFIYSQVQVTSHF